MVVDQIDAGDVSIRDTEHNAPIGAHSYRPNALQIALKRVQAKARQVHVVRRFGAVQHEENILHFFDQVGTNAFAVTFREKAPQSFMLEGITNNCNL